ncbi:MAG: PHP domain-containing protein [bacterium]|jgi:hypothetical protein
MYGRIDLHIHTYYSDGLNSPVEILEIARSKKLRAFAICDHDNLQGYSEIRNLLRTDDPELISGVELSAGKGTDDIHLLGYFIDTDNPALTGTLADFREKRNRRGEIMLSKLKKMGVEVPLELVKEIAGNSAIGRPHVADALLRIGAVKSYEAAFGKYIGDKSPAYVPKENMSPAEAIALIHSAGGLAVLAHPGIGNVSRFIDDLVPLGLDGIEIYHPNHNSQHRTRYKKIAQQHNLLITGGSDFHGRDGKYGLIGSEPVGYDILESLKARYNSRNRGLH